MKTTLARTSIILLILLSSCTPGPAPTAALTALPNNSGIEGVQIFADSPENHGHVPSVKVPEGGIPPMWGKHYAAWQNCGIYDKPVELGNALHSIEHGAVWVTYRPDLATAYVTELQALVRGHGYVLLSPYTGQTADVILTAWGVQLIIESLPDERIAPFIAYFENGPQNPERGAPCSGQVGDPLP